MWKQSDSITSSNLNSNHSVLLGILFVFITFYLTATTLARNFEFYINEGIRTYETYWQHIEDDDNLTEADAAAAARAAQLPGEEDDGWYANSVCNRSQMVCKGLEIFTAIWHTDDNFQDVRQTKRKHRTSGNGRSKNGKSSNSNNRKNHTQQNGNKRNKKTKSNGNGHGNGATKNRRSTAISHKAQQQQQQQQQVKRSSTEPIIYLFALVFIYLLLKAASDINQHYKTQAKDGKRLRRCSLQSYASQTHKLERRASKGIFKNVPKV